MTQFSYDSAIPILATTTSEVNSQGQGVRQLLLVVRGGVSKGARGFFLARLFPRNCTFRNTTFRSHQVFPPLRALAFNHI